MGVSLASANTQTVVSKKRHGLERKEVFSLPQFTQSDVPQGDASEQIVLEGAILDNESEVELEFSRRPRMPIDINAVITRALIRPKQRPTLRLSRWREILAGATGAGDRRQIRPHVGGNADISQTRFMRTRPSSMTVCAQFLGPTQPQQS